MGWIVWVSIPGEVENFTLLQNVWTKHEVDRTSYPVGAGRLFLQLKLPGCGEDHSRSSIAKTNTTSVLTPLKLCVFRVSTGTSVSAPHSHDLLNG